ncbi:MAG: T9SS type A sorting domain-containing protein [Crocinitomicaceae bacterium]
MWLLFRLEFLSFEPCFHSEPKDQNIKKQLLAYPNPTSGKVMIDLDPSSTNVKVELFNSMGQLISSQDYSGSKQINFEIDSPKGMYLLKLSQSSGMNSMIKVIKE